MGSGFVPIDTHVQAALLNASGGGLTNQLFINSSIGAAAAPLVTGILGLDPADVQDQFAFQPNLVQSILDPADGGAALRAAAARVADYDWVVFTSANAVARFMDKLRDARAFGSRGQQRLIALALRLAEILPVTEAAGTAPVLLLDDALSELDPTVRAHVMREIQAAEQVFLTTSDVMTANGAAVFHVNGGSVAPA